LAGSHHSKGEEEKSGILVVPIDNAYVKTKEGREKEEEGSPTLVHTCRETTLAGSLVVPNKADNNYAIKRLSQEINVLGHKRLILKSDQEQAILALKGAVKRERKEDMTLEEPLVGEHQSNGEIERAVREVQGKNRYLVGKDGRTSCER
jgi:hypothetical protein